MAENRCCECGKFKRWAALILTRFIPDNAFSGEICEYTCVHCYKKLQTVRGLIHANV